MDIEFRVFSVIIEMACFMQVVTMMMHINFDVNISFLE